MDTMSKSEDLTLKDAFIERVKVAFLSLMEEGAAPTVREIRHRMSGGSFTWISKALRENRDAWTKQAMEEARTPGKEPNAVAAARLVAPGLLKDLKKLMDQDHAARIEVLNNVLSDYSEANSVLTAENEELRGRVQQQGQQQQVLQDQLGTLRSDLVVLTAAMTQQTEFMQGAFSQMREQAAAATSSVLEGIGQLLVHMNESLEGLRLRTEALATSDQVGATANAVTASVTSAAEIVTNGLSEIRAIAHGVAFRQVSERRGIEQQLRSITRTIAAGVPK